MKTKAENRSAVSESVIHDKHIGLVTVEHYQENVCDLSNRINIDDLE